MRSQDELEASKLAKILERYVGTSRSSHGRWADFLAILRGQGKLVGAVADVKYWIDIYRTRLATAVALNTGMQVPLERVVAELSSYQGDGLSLFISENDGYGYLVWVSLDHSSVVTALEVKDKRI